MASKGLIWVYQELTRRGFRLENHGGLFVVMGADVRGIHQYSHPNKAEKTEMSVSGNYQIQDDITLVRFLKACAKRRDLYKGSTLHAHILQRGLLQKNIFIGNTLIYMFAKCGALAKAQEVFDELLVRDAVSWTALVAAYAEHGHGEDALNCFEQMQHEGLSPDAVTLASILKACGSIGAAEKGEAIHAEIVTKGLLENDTVLGNALVDMYAKCGALTKARQVFDELPVRDVVSWNLLITGYCQHGHGQEALNCFEQMENDSLSPDSVTFACILQACGSIGAAEKGQEIHAEIARMMLLRNGTVLGNALVDMYAKCGALAKALQVFDDLPNQDIFSWSALISGYCQHGHPEEALDCFERMKSKGLSPDAVIFACILKACGNLGTTDRGEEIHSEIVRKGQLESGTVLGSALVDMYAKCGALARAQRLFDRIEVRNIVSWNALITGYCQHGQGEEALSCLASMKCEGFSPDVVTLACILKACGSIGAGGKGEDLHAEILRKGLLENSTVLSNALVDMYAKCGALSRAREVFEEIPARNLVSWNALLTGFCQHGHGEEALNYYERLKSEGLSPDTVTFACLLRACGIVGAAGKGKEIHAEIARLQLLEISTMLGNALVDMYGKCGVPAKAQQVFTELSVRDVVSWNALIAGYCEYGHGSEAFNCFEQMKCDGIRPDAVTFTSILKACGSIGAAEKGQMYFEMMTASYGIIPNLEHHTCMVDLFGRAGHMDKAMAMIKKMPSSGYFPAWCALLGACQKGANVKLGEVAFEHARHLEEESAVGYTIMSSIYSAASMPESADNFEALRMEVPRPCRWTGCTEKWDKGHQQSNVYYS